MDTKMESRGKKKLLLPQKLRYFKRTGEKILGNVLRDMKKKKGKAERNC